MRECVRACKLPPTVRSPTFNGSGDENRSVLLQDKYPLLRHPIRVIVVDDNRRGQLKVIDSET